MATTFKYFLAVIFLVTVSSCRNSVKVDEKKELAQTIVTDTTPAAGDYELEPDTLPAKAEHPVVRNLAELPIKKVGELILKDSIKSLNNEIVSFMLLDSLSAESRQSRDFYFRVFNKIMDRSGSVLSDAIGDYALTYVESYPNEFLANSKNFSPNRLETWASHIGIELFLSGGDAKEAFDKSTQTFQANCKGCQAHDLARLTEFNKLIWITIQQNQVEKKE